MLKIITDGHKEHATIISLFNCCMPEKFNSNITLEQVKEILELKGVELEGFIGSFKVAKSTLTTEVPDTFISSNKLKMKTVQEKVIMIDDFGVETSTEIDVEVPDLDGDGNEQFIQKTWSEYSNNFEDDDFAYIWVGAVNENGNKKNVSNHLELVQWIDYFGIDNLLTKSMTTDAIPIVPEP